MVTVRARELGFCSGVRRAVDLACEAAARQGAVYTLGPLIHNPQVLADLKCRGVEILDAEHLPENLRGAFVIIRAHGISPGTEAELRRRGADVIDATCPRVKSSQLKAAAYAEAGYRLFLAGEEHHAEITGIRGYYEASAGKQEGPGSEPFCAVVGCAAEAEKAAAQLQAKDAALARAQPSVQVKTALIGQTTISAEEYREIDQAVTRFFPDLEVARTICSATRERQEGLREIMGQVEAVVIAGGKKSANSLRLLAIAETAGKPCALAETPADIPPEFTKYRSAGLASGTSTPDTVIDDIECAMRSLPLANSSYLR